MKLVGLSLMYLGKHYCEFINFLQKLNSKKTGEDISPTFKCDGINLVIILIGQTETMQRSEYGYEPYVSFIKSATKEGIKTFYVLARGRLNCYIANEVIWHVTKEQIVSKTDEYLDEIEYQGRRMKTLCVRLENNASTYDPFKDYFPQFSNLTSNY